MGRYAVWARWYVHVGGSVWYQVMLFSIVAVLLTRWVQYWCVGSGKVLEGWGVVSGARTG